MLSPKGPVIGDPLSTDCIVIVNPCERDFTPNRFVFAFGCYGWTRLLAYGRCLEDALDECGDWIADHAPGLLCDGEVEEEYRQGLADGLDEEAAMEAAECDTMPIGGYGSRIRGDEWHIVAENPTRAELLAIAGVLLPPSRGVGGHGGDFGCP